MPKNKDNTNSMSGSIDEKSHKEYAEKLLQLGLTEKEAAVYLVLLRLGEVGSSKIIAATSLHGQFVYAALSGLEKKGLVQHVTRNGRKKFSAKNPKSIVRLVDIKKRAADDLADKLQGLFVLPKDQNVEVFQGEESFVAHEFDLLEQAKPGSELLIIGGSGDQFLKVMWKSLEEYEKIRLSKAIKVRYVGSEQQRKDFGDTTVKRKNFDFRLLPGLFTGSVNTNIWPEAIGFNVFGVPVTSMVITNSILAGSYRQFFETLWNLAK